MWRSKFTNSFQTNGGGLDTHKPMKKLFILAVVMLAGLGSCKKDETISADPLADAKTAIEAKYKALGWDKDGHAPFNGGGAAKTQGGGGYVQYYAIGSGKSAIYYYGGRGAFGMNQSEMQAYDAAGQDKFAFVVSDAKPCGSGCGYNDMIMTKDNSEGINLLGRWVYGEIYKKYKAVNRWDGPLGLPVISESNGQTAGSRYNDFAKTGSTVTGAIIFNSTTGAQAVWGKIYTLWGKTNWDIGWLGLPTESSDPNKADANQKVSFQKGSIGVGSNGTCGNYYDNSGLSVFQNGTKGTGTPPCY